MVFISGNLPLKTEITPLLIVIKLEQFDYNGAAALGFMMLVMSFLMLFAINLVQAWSRRAGSVARRRPLTMAGMPHPRFEKRAPRVAGRCVRARRC